VKSGRVTSISGPTAFFGKTAGRASLMLDDGASAAELLSYSERKAAQLPCAGARSL
jgi:hypothetical protein